LDALPGVFAQLAHGLLDVRAGEELDREEPCLVEPARNRQHHARRHPLGPETLVAIADRGVDETDFVHGNSSAAQACAGPSGRIRNSACPNSTNCPLDTRIFSITPCVSVLTLVNTFITSISPTVAPSATRVPCCT